MTKQIQNADEYSDQMAAVEDDMFSDACGTACQICYPGDVMKRDYPHLIGFPHRSNPDMAGES